MFSRREFQSEDILNHTPTKPKTKASMAQQTKHADPYKEANLETEVSSESKIRDLSAFMTHCKFAMMTTRDAQSGNLVSRCMALAAQVCLSLPNPTPPPY